MILQLIAGAAEPPRRGLLFEQEGAAPVVWHPAGSKRQGSSRDRSKTSGLVGGLLAATVVPLAAKTSQASELEPRDRELFFTSPTSWQATSRRRSEREQGLGSSLTPAFLTDHDNYREQAIGGFSAEPSYPLFSARQCSVSMNQGRNLIGDIRETALAPRKERLSERVSSKGGLEVEEPCYIDTSKFKPKSSSWSFFPTSHVSEPESSDRVFCMPLYDKYKNVAAEKFLGQQPFSVERDLGEQPEMSRLTRSQKPAKQTIWERRQALDEEMAGIRRQIEINQSAGFVDTISFGLTKPLSKKIIDESLPGYELGQGVGIVLETIGGGALIKEMVIPKAIEGVQWAYRGYLAKQAAREAFAGGKYAGQINSFLKQNVRQLQKSIRSFDKLIEQHKQWIKDPTIKYKDWDKMSSHHKQDVIHHWKMDIQRATNYKEIAKQTLKSKTEEVSLQKGVKYAP